MSLTPSAVAGPVFLNDGGPLMVLARHPLEDWVGATDDDGLGGDYDRAIATVGLVDTLEVGGEIGIVLGSDEPVSSAQWIRQGDRWIVVAWFMGDEDSDEQLMARLQSGLVTDWVPLAAKAKAENGLVLFHPASSGAELAGAEPLLVDGISLLAPYSNGAKNEAVIGDALIAPTPGVTYSIDRAHVQIEDELDCALVRWTPTKG